MKKDEPSTRRTNCIVPVAEKANDLLPQYRVPSGLRIGAEEAPSSIASRDVLMTMKNVHGSSAGQKRQRLRSVVQGIPRNKEYCVAGPALRPFQTMPLR